MTDFVKLQNDIYLALLSCEQLASVNVKQFRKMVIESEIDMKLVFLTARNSRVGAGILVEMPLLGVDKPNVEGPILEVQIPVLVMEQPSVNMDATTGTTKSAEEIVQDVLDVLHLYHIEGFGLLRAAASAVSPATEYRGVIAYRVNLATMSSGTQTRRPAMPSITLADGVATISCSTDGATIYYTTDGSYPAKSGNPQSHEYSDGVPVESGDMVRAAAYKTGMNISPVKMLNVP